MANLHERLCAVTHIEALKFNFSKISSGKCFSFTLKFCSFKMSHYIVLHTYMALVEYTV